MKREIPIKSFAISLFILKPRDDTFDLLLLRRTGSTLTEEWCQVAGGIEHGETAWQAALREAEEKTGLCLTELYSADICEQFYSSASQDDRHGCSVAARPADGDWQAFGLYGVPDCPGAAQA